MASSVELLGTDMFREEHRIIGLELDEIERELEHVIETKGSWRAAIPVMRRLLVLLEADVENHADDEERLIYGPLSRAIGRLTPTLTECYREHHELRIECETLRHELTDAFAGKPADADGMFARCAGLIGLLRVHMARENEVLFLAAEQGLSHEDLLAMTRPSPAVPVRDRGF